MHNNNSDNNNSDNDNNNNNNNIFFKSWCPVSYEPGALTKGLLIGAFYHTYTANTYIHVCITIDTSKTTLSDLHLLNN